MRQTTPIRIKHFANAGDVIAALPACKAYYEATKRKVIFSQQLNVTAQYYPGATHPVVNENGQMVCMNRQMFDMVKPLVATQEYIHDMEIFDGQDVGIDFDVIRNNDLFVNMPHGSIQAWLMYAYPDLAYDITKPWLQLPDKKLPNILRQVKGKVIINFTERYRNTKINYYFLRKFQNHLIFSGTDREYYLFVNAWRLDIPRLDVKDFLEYAYAIKWCKFILSNQSVGWNIAEAMKTPRILEVSRYADNCMPFYGEKSYGFYHQEGVEFYVDALY